MRKRSIPVLLFQNRRSYDVKLFSSLVTAIRQEGIDLIHSHEFFMNSYGAMASMLTGVPLLATVHGRNYYGDRLRRRVMYRAVSRWACLVAVCEATKEYLVEHVGVARGRVRVVYNGVEVDEIPAIKAKGVHGSSHRSPTIATVGRLSPVKGHSHLLLAARELVQRWRDLRVLIVGKGRLEGVLRQQVVDLGLSKNVIFTGHLEDVSALWNHVDAFILPSLSEGMPLSLLEAMAAGVPPVATRVGGVVEAIEDGKTGLLVPAGDSQALAEAIRRLLEDQTLANEIGKSARQTVAGRFSLPRMVQAYHEIYAELTGKSERDGVHR
jgi:glycosyltransferase involved in cell wall biosynthesis